MLPTNTFQPERSDFVATASRPEGDMDAETLELLQRQVEIQRQLIKLVKEDGLALYRPHYYQHLFHSSPAKRRGAFTGNRFGKSKMDGAETAAWAKGERTWYKVPFDIYGIDIVAGRRIKVLRETHPGGETHPLVRQGIPPYATKQLIVCANWDKVDKIWTSQSADRPGYIWQFLPKGFARGYTNHAGVIAEIVCTNGSVIEFMSVDAFKKNRMVAESSDHDRIVFDEPAPKALWKGVSRGLVDRAGQADFALTALEEAWIPEKFDGVAGNDSGSGDEDKPFRPEMRYSFRASMRDNPHLTDQAITDYENELTEDERECRINGIPLEYSGLIYKEFKKDIHVLKDVPEGWLSWAQPTRSSILHIRIDTHPVKPHAVMFACVGPSEIPVVYHEIYRSCDADTLCELINEHVKSTRCFIGSIHMEPGAWINDPATKTSSIASYFAKHNLFPRKATKDLKTGIIITRGAFKNSKVLISPECRRTLWELSRYRYDPETSNPIDEEDHMMENLYRLLIHPTRWFNPDTAAGEAIPEDDFSNATSGMHSSL